MQTQAKVQLDERDKNPGIVRPPFNPLQVVFSLNIHGILKGNF